MLEGTVTTIHLLLVIGIKRTVMFKSSLSCCLPQMSFHGLLSRSSVEALACLMRVTLQNSLYSVSPLRMPGGSAPVSAVPGELGGLY